MGKTLNDLPYLRASKAKKFGKTSDKEVQYTRAMSEKMRLEKDEDEPKKAYHDKTYPFGFPTEDMDIGIPAKVFDKMYKRKPNWKRSSKMNGE